MVVANSSPSTQGSYSACALATRVSSGAWEDRGCDPDFDAQIGNFALSSADGTPLFRKVRLAFNLCPNAEGRSPFRTSAEHATFSDTRSG